MWNGWDISKPTRYPDVSAAPPQKPSPADPLTRNFLWPCNLPCERYDFRHSVAPNNIPGQIHRNRSQLESNP